MAESFVSTLECELLGHRRFRSQAEARMAISSSFETFYNPRAVTRLPLARRLRAGAHARTTSHDRAQPSQLNRRNGKDNPEPLLDLTAVTAWPMLGDADRAPLAFRSVSHPRPS